MNNIFVGNLSFKATKEDVIKLFEPFGSVANAVIMERKKGKSRGYGFVDMPNEEEKNAAILALQGKEFMWRVLSVSPVIPKVKREVKKEVKKEVKRELKSDRGPGASTGKPRSDFKSYRRDDRNPGAVNSSESGSKYYSKFDGPPKPWRKVNPGSKPSGKKDTGSRPYYGKKDGEHKSWDKKEVGSKPYVKEDRTSRPNASKSPYKKFEGQSKSLATGESGRKLFNKPSKGFKMFHKVSGASKVWPKKPTQSL